MTADGVKLYIYIKKMELLICEQICNLKEDTWGAGGRKGNDIIIIINYLNLKYKIN